MNRAAVARTGLILARRALWSAAAARARAARTLDGVAHRRECAGPHGPVRLGGAAPVPKAVHVNLLGWAFTLAMLMLVVGDRWCRRR
jgi:hypothetical protein